MNRKTYGLVTGLIAIGVGTWWWRTRLSDGTQPEFDGRGTVIFDNTPHASPDGNA